jgi:hypothetical protein
MDSGAVPLARRVRNDGAFGVWGVSFKAAIAIPVSFRRHLRYEPRNRWLRPAPVADILRRHSDLAP